MKKQTKLTISQAAEKLADVLNEELAKLSPAEQRKRAEAFHEFVTSRVGSAAKSPSRARRPQTPLAAHVRG